MTKTEKYNYILNYFGVDHQGKKLMEEILELGLALQNVKNLASPGNMTQAYEEFADNKVLCKQLGISDEEFEKMFLGLLDKFNLKATFDYVAVDMEYIEALMGYKLERTVSRITKGYYESKF